MGVCGKGSRVGVCANASRRVVDPVTHGVILSTSVVGLQANGSGHEVTPAFSHTTRLQGAKAVGVSRTTGKASGETVSVLVNDNAGVEAGVAVRGRPVPDVHAHAALLSIRRSGEVGIVSSTAVLSVQNDFVVAATAVAVVVDLEVTGSFGEAKLVEQVVVLVRDVEELSDRSVNVGGRRAGGGCVREHVVVGAAATGPVVVEVAGAAGGVGLSNSIVATGNGVARSSDGVPTERRSRRDLRVGNGRPAAIGGVVDSPRATDVLANRSIDVEVRFRLTRPGRMHQQPSQQHRGSPRWC